MAGISGASAADVETAQTQINNTNIVQEKVNIKINETNSTNNSTVTQKNVDNLKIVKKQFKKYKHSQLQKTPNKNSVKQMTNKTLKQLTKNSFKHAKHDMANCSKNDDLRKCTKPQKKMAKYTKDSGLKKCTEAHNMSDACKNSHNTKKTAIKTVKINGNQTKAHTMDITAYNHAAATIKEIVNIQNTAANQSTENTTLIPIGAKSVFNQITTDKAKINETKNVSAQTRSIWYNTIKDRDSTEKPEAAAGEPKTTGTVSSTNEAPMAAGSPSTSKVPASLQPYLKATKNCQVTNAQIKTLAAKITKGKTTTYQKAVAVFNWVRDNLGYSFYYNTKKGAVGTLNAKTGNCVDTAHLLIALSRAAGIPARYVHGNAKFTSGKTYGHVWTEIYVNGKWYKADASSNKNSFGVVKSWTSATIKGRYASLSF